MLDKPSLLAMSAEDQQLLAGVADYLGHDLDEVMNQEANEDWDPISDDVFDLLDASKHEGGCVPSAYADSDLLKSVRKKYACVFWPVLLGIAEQIGCDKHELTLVIDPDYEDHTRVVILHDKQHLVLVRYTAKPWHFKFATFGELTELIRQQIAEAVSDYRDLTDRYKA